MKTLKSIAAFAAITMALGLSVSAQAQSIQVPGEKQVSNSDLHNRISQPASAAGMKSVRASAVDPILDQQVAQLNRATDEALSIISFETLSNTDSRAEVRATVKTDAANTIVDDHNVNVKVGFEARPIGGILTVQVSMAPSFRGIGVSTRPVVSRSVAQAVDSMDEAIVRQMVGELTQEIHNDFAAQGGSVN